VLAEDAISGQPISLLHTVSLTLDTIAPAVPVLDPVASPVEDGPAVVTGTTTAGTVVSLRLDGEHIAFAYPDESGHFTHLGVRIPSGTHLLSAVAIDGTGNESTASAAQSIDSTTDLTPPVTTVTLDGTSAGDNRFTSDVTVSLGATDDFSGVDGIQYSLDLGAWQAYSAPFVVSQSGDVSVRFRATDLAGNEEDVQVVHFTIGLLAEPEVVETIVNGGQSQRSRLDSIALRFSVDVGASLTVEDLVVTNVFSGQAVSSSAMSLAYDPVTFTATWTFPGLAAGTLPDGRFTAVLPAGAVANADGGLLAADHAVAFGVLAGDLDGNGLVNDRDLYAVWTNLLRDPALRDPAADVDRSGTVDSTDLTRLGAIYLSSLPAAGSAAPSVTGVVVGDGTTQRSRIDKVVVTFDAHVGGSLDVADLVITNPVTGIAIDPADMQVAFDPVALTATWTFPGLAGGVLPDGNYSLSLAAAAVTDAVGRALGADTTVGFHVLRGDANGDRAVNDLDLYRVWTESQRPAGQQAAAADLDGDGTVDAADLAIVAGHYLATLPGVGAAAPSVTGTVLGNGTAQRSRVASIGIVFDAYVADSLDPSDLVVTNLTTGSTVPSGMMVVAFEPATRTATWSFPGLPGGVLPDGNYTAVLAASAVNDLAGRSLAVGASFSFHVLRGDANADRVTNDEDLAFVWGQSQLPVWDQDPAADLDGDGTVGYADLSVIAGNYLAFLPAPLAPVPAPTLLDDLLAAVGSADGDAEGDDLQLTDLGTVPETNSLTVS